MAKDPTSKPRQYSAPKRKPRSFTPQKTYENNAGLHILNQAKPATGPWDKGGRYEIPDISADKSDTWNMVMTNPAKKNLYLWVDDIEINFSMQGSFGQSRWRRQFFPMAANAPVMTVSGIAPSQKQYASLNMFMREAHYQALKYSSTQKAEGRSYGGSKQYPLPTVRFALKPAGKKNSDNQGNTKGGHQALIFEGYLKNIEAGVTKFQFARQFQFQVVLAASTMNGNIGIYEDTLSTGSDVLSWMTLFQDNQFGAKNWKQMQAGGEGRPDYKAADGAGAINTVQSVADAASSIFNQF